jgi:hypothetical protein
MRVTNLKTSLADRSVGPVDPSFEPATTSSSNAAREERMVVDGIDRYRARQDRLADRGTAALLASDAPGNAWVGLREGGGRSSRTYCSPGVPVHYPQH